MAGGSTNDLDLFGSGTLDLTGSTGNTLLGTTNVYGGTVDLDKRKATPLSRNW